MSDTAERLYEHALALPPERRAAFLAEACPDDAGLRAELLSLLACAAQAEDLFALLRGAVSSPLMAMSEAGDDEASGGNPASLRVSGSNGAERSIGSTVAHYRILSHIGSGGMGTVYRALDTRLNREVALKFLPPHASGQRDAEQRLLVEARAAAALQHPNVCVIHDIGVTDAGHPFIAMALCDGETLKARLGRGPMPLDEAVAVAAQLARGLAAAHARGIVHRDVKPANVMLGPDAAVKLLDFGLAKVSDVTITRPGTTPGTMAYMSPEQVRGDAVDHRTDLWSLGVVLHEMVTGIRPFRGGSDRALAQAILHDDPPPVSVHRTEAPPTLAGIVARLLRKQPDARYGSAGELLVDLAEALAPRTGPVPHNEPQRVAAVHAYAILDTPPESEYDQLVELAARICRVPVAYIKFFDDVRAWFKSKVGLPPDLTEVPREASVCNSTICQSDLVVISDCAVDERVRDNPTVTGWPNVRFYCGMPLIDAQGYALGTFCVFDYEPREMSFEHQELIRTLASQVVRHLEMRRLSIQLQRSLSDLERAKHDIERERARSQAFLDELLPHAVADELMATGHVQPRHYPLATVLFSEFHDFPALAAAMVPAHLLHALDEYVTAFDEIVERHGLERIKTFGDCYLAVSGVPAPSRSHVADACLTALAMQAAAARINRDRAAAGLQPWELRIGLHVGPIMTGIVGRRKVSFDVWGDVVKVSQRIAATGAPGGIAISEPVYQRVRHLVDVEPLGTLEVPGRDALPMYSLIRIKPELSAEPARHLASGRQATPPARPNADVAPSGS